MGQIIKGKCVDISSEGKGVIKTVYGVIFVDALLLGEEAEIEVTYARKGVAYGKIKSKRNYFLLGFTCRNRYARKKRTSDNLP